MKLVLVDSKKIEVFFPFFVCIVRIKCKSSDFQNLWFPEGLKETQNIRSYRYKLFTQSNVNVPFFTDVGLHLQSYFHRIEPLKNLLQFTSHQSQGRLSAASRFHPTFNFNFKKLAWDTFLSPSYHSTPFKLPMIALCTS